MKGLAFMTTEKHIRDGIRNIGYPIPDYVSYYSEWRDTYINFPIHMNCKLLNYESFKFFISAGPELIIHTHHYYHNPSWAGTIGHGVDTRLGVGLEIGFIEWIKINNRIGIFASQYYGKLSIGDLRDYESIDLKLGLIYRFNQ